MKKPKQKRREPKSEAINDLLSGLGRRLDQIERRHVPGVDRGIFAHFVGSVINAQVPDDTVISGGRIVNGQEIMFKATFGQLRELARAINRSIVGGP